MVEFVLESPLWVGVIGAVLTLVAIQRWVSTGSREAMQIGLGVLVVSVVLVALGAMIETEKEALRTMLYQTADNLKSNRKSEVVSVIYSNPTEQVIAAKRYLNEGKYEFDAASIKKIHSIDFSGPPSARRAVVKMNVFIEGRFEGYLVKHPSYVEVTLYRVANRWLVYDFTHDQPLSGFKIGS